MLVLTLSLFLPRAFAQEKDSPRKIVHRFFTLVHRRCYRQAYDHFSKSVKQEVSFSRFKQGAQDVKYLKILKIENLDWEENLIKLKIRALLRLVYKGQLYEAIYEGKVDLYREENKWKVMTVDLEAKTQKALGRKAKPGELQKLDFGTN